MRNIILLQTDMCVDMDFYYQFNLKFINKLELYKYSRAPISCASKIWTGNNPESSQVGKNMLK